MKQLSLAFGIAVRHRSLNDPSVRAGELHSRLCVVGGYSRRRRVLHAPNQFAGAPTRPGPAHRLITAQFKARSIGYPITGAADIRPFLRQQGNGRRLKEQIPCVRYPTAPSTGRKSCYRVDGLGAFCGGAVSTRGAGNPGVRPPTGVALASPGPTNLVQQRRLSRPLPSKSVTLIGRTAKVSLFLVESFTKRR